MKKQIALGLLAAVAAGGTFAQSSVTVYGRLNVTVESSKYGEDGDRQGEVNNNSSRIGFKGTEDLGGGLKAGFQIEHGFDPTEGTAADPFWGRQSEVNLGGAFGTIRLGNFTPESYYATADYISMHNHDTGDSSDALYDFSTYVTANKVGYSSPNFSGFNFHVSVAEGSAAVERTYDLAANYQGGPLHLGAGFSKTGDVRQFAIRGLYEFGAFTVGALAQRSSADDADRTYFRLSGMYTMGASEFHLNFGRAGEIDGLDDSAANQWTVGYNYNLSKRTKVYTYYTVINSGDYTFLDANNVPTQLYGGDQNHFAIGIRHNF
jgi:predicted porin